MCEARATSATVQPWRRAAKTANSRCQLGDSSRERSATGSARALSRAARSPSSSSDARPLSSASRKVEPIAITSPTDFIAVPSSGGVCGNFSKAQRGILTTV